MTTRRVYTLLLILAGVLSALYFMRAVYPGCAAECYMLHNLIISGDAGSPYRYRVLSTFAVELLTRVSPGDAMAANAFAYTAAHVVVLPLLLLTLRQWLLRWISDDRAMIAALAFALLLPLGFTNYALSLYTPVEVALFSVGLLMLQRERVNLFTFGALLIVATLNRETSVILVAAYLAVTRSWRGAAALAVVWLGTYAGLRIVLGSAQDVGSTLDWWTANTGAWLSTGVLHNLFMIPFWAAAALRIRNAPAQLQRLLLIVALVYLPLLLVFSQWHEVRLQWVMFPLLLPIALGGAHVGCGLSVRTCGDHRGVSDGVSSGDRDTARSGRAGSAAAECDARRSSERTV